jgi:hypothetical protein
MSRRVRCALGLIAASVVMSAAQAQMTAPVLQPVINFDYSRGRNTSVNERSRPEYTSTGVPVGGFTVFPTLNLGVGFTNNLYGTDSLKRSSAYFTINPDVRAISNWTRHFFQLQATGNLRRNTVNSIRDEDAWSVGGSGRLDIGQQSSLSLRASRAQAYETRFSGSTPADTASSTPYSLTRVTVQGNTTAGRLKLTATGGYNATDFSAIQLIDGSSISQKFRNREVLDFTGRAAYAVSPDAAIFGQFQYNDTNYDRDFATGANFRNSREYRGLVGVNMDLTALVRGSIAVGYADRSYESPLYNSVKGVSFETKLEYFPSEITTVTLMGRRVIEDASIAGSSGYFNTGAGVRVDHEFLRNLIANAGLDYEVDTYRGLDAKSKIFTASAGARYLISRMVGIGANVTYGQRDNSGTVRVGPTLHETSGLLSLYLQK